MFGTIGHARLKPGQRPSLDALSAEWQQTIRPQIPGEFVRFHGNRAGSPDEIVFVALAQDQATYRNLADMPEQDAWYRRLLELLDGQVQWEDVELEAVPT